MKTAEKIVAFALLAIITLSASGAIYLGYQDDRKSIKTDCNGNYMTKIPNGCAYDDGYYRCEWKKGGPVICEVILDRGAA